GFSHNPHQRALHLGRAPITFPQHAGILEDRCPAARWDTGGPVSRGTLGYWRTGVPRHAGILEDLGVVEGRCDGGVM
ncbi:hypothetical protein chiPu_0026549, partial [Chiloscyllium punctatum]|nr:hypothetical protein [Chiloscyllium punctatum]